MSVWINSIWVDSPVAGTLTIPIKLLELLLFSLFCFISAPPVILVHDIICHLNSMTSTGTSFLGWLSVDEACVGGVFLDCCCCSAMGDISAHVNQSVVGRAGSQTSVRFSYDTNVLIRFVDLFTCSLIKFFLIWMKSLQSLDCIFSYKGVIFVWVFVLVLKLLITYFPKKKKTSLPVWAFTTLPNIFTKGNSGTTKNSS